VLAPYFGTSVTVWACLIGVFLAALSVGNFIGGRVADYKPASRLLALFIIAAAATSVLVPLTSERICTYITRRRFGFPLDPLVATGLLFFLPTLFLGAVTPFAIRMLLPSVERAGMTSGGIYGLSTVGNIFGTFLTAFYLIQTFGVRKILFFWSGFLLVLGGVLATVPTRSSSRAKRATLLVIPLCACFLAGPSLSQADIVYTRDTLYHHILVEDIGGLRLLKFDAAIQSAMSLVNPLEGALEYTDFFHTAFVFNENIRRTLFIGLGGGSGPKRFLYDYTDMNVDVVEIDPVVVEVAEQFFGVRKEPRLDIVIEDGRVFLNQTNRQYDLIVLDAYLSSAYGPYIPFHLATQEFFAKARDRLTVAGVLVYNVIGTVQGPESMAVRSIHKTMGTVFPSLYMFPAETSMNVVIVAAKRKVEYIPPQVYDIGNRLFLERKVRLPAFLRRLTRCIAWAPPVADVPVLTDDFAPIESLQAAGVEAQQIRQKEERAPDTSAP
jgi:spermidine synthase